MIRPTRISMQLMMHSSTTRLKSARKAYEKLRRLGALYDKEGKYDVEIKLFKKLNELYPYHPKAPVNQSAMNAWAQLDSKEDVRREAAPSLTSTQMVLGEA